MTGGLKFKGKPFSFLWKSSITKQNKKNNRGPTFVVLIKVQILDSFHFRYAAVTFK